MNDGNRETVSESYAFVCLRCTYGWEQTFLIEHHQDENGRPYVLYFVGMERVPSPLARLTCHRCGSHRVRVMQAGTVRAVQRASSWLPSGGLAVDEPADPPHDTEQDQAESEAMAQEAPEPADAAHHHRHHHDRSAGEPAGSGRSWWRRH
ncbi:hypothetical protein [Streptomyces bohaiensis]|uniref:hypothetical protein n=1 Tax=Streptomyces bohaiensis TaxID=1431344 RepID=UPI001ADDBF0C|nr:hypothetical protein [Streptomyces bohaiensis]